MNTWAKIILGDSRAMPEVEDQSIDLVVTSPPYWHIKDYGIKGQIGYGQTLHEYLKDLYYVWRECFRVLQPGRRLCLNIGDQFARAAVYGRYKIIPLHAEFIGQCEQIGFDFMGAIIWQKKTTMNTTGGANIMGSYPFPPNGLVEIDYEFILIFKKPGKGKRVSKEVKEASKLSKEEWKKYFSGHWHFGGARQVGHEAMFPEELPRRLIKMFTFVGDTVLDPFLGSGTTVKVALGLGRNALGYEIHEDFQALLQEKIGKKDSLPFYGDVHFIRRCEDLTFMEVDYVPRIKDDRVEMEKKGLDFKGQDLHKVVHIEDETTIRLDNGQLVQFLGVRVEQREETLKYLNNLILGRKVFLRNSELKSGEVFQADVYLKNKIHINGYLLKTGLGSVEPHCTRTSTSSPKRPGPTTVRR